LIPFYVTARDLAEAWQGETDFLPACARAAARALGHRVLHPLLVERVLRLALQEGRALLLIDALDEYRAETADRRAFVESLSAQWRALPADNRLVLASRPAQFFPQDFANDRLPALSPRDATSAIPFTQETALSRFCAKIDKTPPLNPARLAVLRGLGA
jgi:hypothetical protein